MRHCVFVVDSRQRLAALAPLLRKAGDTGLRHDLWFVDDDAVDANALRRELGITARFASAGKRAGRKGLHGAARFFDHVGSLRTWTQAAPLVVVFAESVSAFLATIAGRLAGGWIVHLESGISSGHLFAPFPAELLRRMTCGMTNFALCADDASFERMRRHHCKVAHIGASISGAAADGPTTPAHDAALNALRSWSG